MCQCNRCRVTAVTGEEELGLPPFSLRQLGRPNRINVTPSCYRDLGEKDSEAQYRCGRYVAFISSASRAEMRFLTFRGWRCCVDYLARQLLWLASLPIRDTVPLTDPLVTLQALLPAVTLPYYVCWRPSPCSTAAGGKSDNTHGWVLPAEPVRQQLIYLGARSISRRS